MLQFQDNDPTHQNSPKGLVSCCCQSCGVMFFRTGDELLYQTRYGKQFPRISEKKIIEACAKNDIKSLEPQSDTDFAMLKIHLCDQCLKGFRKPKQYINENQIENLKSEQKIK